MANDTRTGDWIKTFTGIKFYPIDPRFYEVKIEDIAHALSQICRFAGHTKVFYSVAQHCILGADEFHRRKEFDLARAFLLHDAAEAYFGDLSRPMKRSIVGWREIEERLQWAINLAYNIHPNPKQMEAIKIMDNSLLYTEGDQLMTGGTKDWHDAESVQRLELIIHPMSSEGAEAAFLDSFEDLFQPNLGE